jgi:hypothetical protein
MQPLQKGKCILAGRAGNLEEREDDWPAGEFFL